MKTSSEQLSTDELLTVLSDVQRRKLLSSLVADSPPDGSPAIVVEESTVMRHSHLPKLAEYGLIEWDDVTNEVTTGPNFEQARRFLESLAAYDDELLAESPADD